MNHLINKEIQFEDWGLIRYADAWDKQKTYLNQTLQIKLANRNLLVESQLPTPNYLIFCEHPNVYTLGKSGKQQNLLLNQTDLQNAGIEFFPIDRGGDITYHGPGQIIGYLIFDLENFFTDIGVFLRMMEEGIIQTLSDYGLVAGRIKGLTGVWLDSEGIIPRKIAAMGIKCSRWISMHGFALNINTDLQYFTNIIPCGIPDKPVTSLQQELNQKIDIQIVKVNLKKKIIKCFCT